MQLVFSNPAGLWWLLTLPVLLFAHYFFLRYAKKRALTFANFRALKRVTGERLITRNYIVLALRLASLLLLVLAVSGAILWYEGSSSKNDFVLAVDTSSSMSAQDVLPTRMDAARADAQLFVDGLDANTRVGVVSFSGVALIESVPLADRTVIKQSISRLEPLLAGGTDIPGAIITSTNLLLDKANGRAIVLITDGSSTIETFLDSSLQRSLDYAKENHVRIHTIGIGSDTGPIGYLPTYYNISATYNEDNLKQIANATSGMYVHVNSTQQLQTAFKAIAENTDKQLLEYDLRPLLMLLALTILLAEWILVNTRFRTIP